MADNTRDPRPYELMLVFVPDLSDEELGDEIQTVSGYITQQGGTISQVLQESPWGRRRLAYTIRFNSVDYRDGIYTLVHFDSRPSEVREIERELKLNTRLIRYLLVHNDPLAGERVRPGSLDEEEPAAEQAAAEAAPAPDAAQAATAETPSPETRVEADRVAEAAPEAEASAPAGEAAAPAEEPAVPASEAAPAAESASDETQEA